MSKGEALAAVRADRMLLPAQPKHLAAHALLSGKAAVEALSGCVGRRALPTRMARWCEPPAPTRPCQVTTTAEPPCCPSQGNARRAPASLRVAVGRPGRGRGASPSAPPGGPPAVARRELGASPRDGWTHVLLQRAAARVVVGASGCPSPYPPACPCLRAGLDPARTCPLPPPSPARGLLLMGLVKWTAEFVLNDEMPMWLVCRRGDACSRQGGTHCC